MSDRDIEEEPSPVGMDLECSELSSSDESAALSPSRQQSPVAAQLPSHGTQTNSGSMEGGEGGSSIPEAPSAPLATDSPAPTAVELVSAFAGATLIAIVAPDIITRLHTIRNIKSMLNPDEVSRSAHRGNQSLPGNQQCAEISPGDKTKPDSKKRPSSPVRTMGMVEATDHQPKKQKVSKESDPCCEQVCEDKSPQDAASSLQATSDGGKSVPQATSNGKSAQKATSNSKSAQQAISNSKSAQQATSNGKSVQQAFGTPQSEESQGSRSSDLCSPHNDQDQLSTQNPTSPQSKLDVVSISPPCDQDLISPYSAQDPTMPHSNQDPTSPHSTLDVVSISPPGDQDPTTPHSNQDPSSPQSNQDPTSPCSAQDPTSPYSVQDLTPPHSNQGPTLPHSNQDSMSPTSDQDKTSPNRNHQDQAKIQGLAGIPAQTKFETELGRSQRETEEPHVVNEKIQNQPIGIKKETAALVQPTTGEPALLQQPTTGESALLQQPKTGEPALLQQPTTGEPALLQGEPAPILRQMTEEPAAAQQPTTSISRTNKSSQVIPICVPHVHTVQNPQSLQNMSSSLENVSGPSRPLVSFPNRSVVYPTLLPMGQQAAASGLHHGGLAFDVMNELNGRRKRKTFTDWQYAILESHFGKDPYAPAELRKLIADQTGLTECNVQVWFQNRRTKIRRREAEVARCSVPSQLKETGGNGQLSLLNRRPQLPTHLNMRPTLTPGLARPLYPFVGRPPLSAINDYKGPVYRQMFPPYQPTSMQASAPNLAEFRAPNPVIANQQLSVGQPKVNSMEASRPNMMLPLGSAPFAYPLNALGAGSNMYPGMPPQGHLLNGNHNVSRSDTNVHHNHDDGNQHHLKSVSKIAVTSPKASNLGNKQHKTSHPKNGSKQQQAQKLPTQTVAGNSTSTKVTTSSHMMQPQLQVLNTNANTGFMGGLGLGMMGQQGSLPFGQYPLGPVARPMFNFGLSSLSGRPQVVPGTNFTAAAQGQPGINSSGLFGGGGIFAGNVQNGYMNRIPQTNVLPVMAPQENTLPRVVTPGPRQGGTQRNILPAHRQEQTQMNAFPGLRQGDTQLNVPPILRQVQILGNGLPTHNQLAYGRPTPSIRPREEPPVPDMNLPLDLSCKKK